jgi:hypothetical protein
MKLPASGLWGKIILLSESCLMAFGVWLMWRFIQVNHIRADELLSYWHSAFFTPTQAFQHMQAGVDHSYTHAVLLSIAFKFFGAGIEVQRLLSLCFWAMGGAVLFRLLRKQHVATEMSLLAVAFVLFSNLGIFLATDGRFYSMLFCFAIVQCHQVLSLKEPLGKLGLMVFILTALLGVLTSMLYLVFLVFLLALLLLLRVSYSYTHIPVARLCYGLLIVAGVYFIFFRIDFFIGFLQQVYVHDVVPRMPDSEQLTIPFRWLMLPHVPFLSLQTDVVLFILFFGWLIVKYRKTQTGNVLHTFTLIAVICLGLLFVAQLVLQAFVGVPVWVPRYYAIIFFGVPVLFTLLLSKVEYTIRMALIVCLCAGMFSRLAVEYNKIPAREKMQTQIAELAAQLRNESCVVVVEQPMHPTFELSVYGELFIRYPSLRSKMHMVFERGPMGDEYVQLLQKLGYPVGVTVSQQMPDLRSCLVLRHPNDNRVFEAKSTRALFSPIPTQGD